MEKLCVSNYWCVWAQQWCVGRKRRTRNQTADGFISWTQDISPHVSGHLNISDIKTKAALWLFELSLKTEPQVSMPPISITSRIRRCSQCICLGSGHPLQHAIAALPLCLGHFLCPVSLIHSLGSTPGSQTWALFFGSGWTSKIFPSSG